MIFRSVPYRMEVSLLMYAVRFKVYEYTLGCFRTKIYVFASSVTPWKVFEHKVKLTYIGKVMASTCRTCYIVFPLIYSSIFRLTNRLRLCPASFMAEILYKFVCTETFFTVFAVHKRVGKSAKMSAGNPCLRVHKYSAVKTYVILVILLHKFFHHAF